MFFTTKGAKGVKGTKKTVIFNVSSNQLSE